MSLHDKIQDAIREHLPEALGKELQSLLAAAEESNDRAEAQQRELERFGKLVNNLRDENTDLRSDLRRAGDVAAREDAVAARERVLDNDILAIKLQEAERRADVVTDLVKTLVSAPTFKSRTTGNVPLAVGGMPASQYGQGSAGYVDFGHVDLSSEHAVG